MLRIVEGREQERLLTALANRSSTDLTEVEPVVRRIIREIRQHGDRALREYAARWDGLGKNEPLRVSEDELQGAWRKTDSNLRDAIERAAANIRQFAQWQLPKSWQREIEAGVKVGQLVQPLQSVGCYVPGGRYPLPSSVLMTVIPAQVAGVERIAVVSPRPARATLAAAAFLGVREFYRTGGAQAIAALAYGTNEIARVTKIVGPGNRYVTAAKKAVAFDCGIEFLAGPTEAVIVSENGDPACIASDLVAQAEHDPDALCVFITTSCELAKRVQKEASARAAENVIAAQSLTRRGLILLASSPEHAMQMANRIASEHLTVPAKLANLARDAGTVFVDEFTPQAAGDYVSGPNHVLPTGAMARVRGGLNTMDFVRIVGCQQVSFEGIKEIAPIGITLAAAEGLKGHAEAFRARLLHAQGTTEAFQRT
jgi:histidinol dehydrogenase